MKFAAAKVELDRRSDGAIVMRSPQKLGFYSRCITEWLVEWSDRNALVRRKVPFQLLHVGDTVTITASPSRLLDNLAYFRTALLPDKSLLRDCGFAAFRKAIENGETVECEAEKAK